MPILVDLILSLLGSLEDVPFAGIPGRWALVGWILLLTVPDHAGRAALLVWGFPKLATSFRELARQKRERWMKPKA